MLTHEKGGASGCIFHNKTALARIELYDDGATDWIVVKGVLFWKQVFNVALPNRLDPKDWDLVP